MKINQAVKNLFKERLNAYQKLDEVKEWLSTKYDTLQQLYSDKNLRDFIFEPFKEVFRVEGIGKENEIKAIITQVAVTNAVLAGLPGKMGVGVVVSIGLEAWMAYSIAKRVGIQIEKPIDILKYFSLLTGISLIILEGFRHLLGFGFSIFSIVLPAGLNPLLFAELFVTNLVGVMFWFAFEELKKNGTFTIPKSMFLSIIIKSREMFKHQYDMIAGVISYENIKKTAARLKSFLNGEIVIDYPYLRGEFLPTVSMVWLIAGEFSRLDGPIGQQFIASIRDRFTSLQDASLEEIAEHMSQYHADSMIGVINLVKGQLFERLVEIHENADGDVWIAALHEDRTYPGSDIVFTNTETQESVEISLKSTGDHNYIESALSRYPDIPIITTKEMDEYFSDNNMVTALPISDTKLEEVTEENFDSLLGRLSNIETIESAATGATVTGLLQLWPFVVAYLRKRITYDQLETACSKVCGDYGVMLASRISYAVILGPIFAWYLLARGTVLITKAAEPNIKDQRKLICNIRQTIKVI